MTDVKVYEPCACCDGYGYYEATPASLSSIPAGATGPKTFCTLCSGTGKGRVKEIREEPTTWPK